MLLANLHLTTHQNNTDFDKAVFNYLKNFFLFPEKESFWTQAFCLTVTKGNLLSKQIYTRNLGVL